MSRNPRLNDWPECLRRLSREVLLAERSHWETKQRFLGHPAASKEAEKRVRDVERELELREESDE